MRAEKPMVVDCDTCPVRHVRCDECMVTAFRSLLALPGQPTAPIEPTEPRLAGGPKRSGLPAGSVRPVSSMSSASSKSSGLAQGGPARELGDELGHGELPLDASEQRAVARFVRAGVVSPEQAVRAAARHEPWTGVAAVG